MSGQIFTSAQWDGGNNPVWMMEVLAVAPETSLTRLVNWQKVTITAAGCWSALVGLIPLAFLLIPVGTAPSSAPPNESFVQFPPIRFERVVEYRQLPPANPELVAQEPKPAAKAEEPQEAIPVAAIPVAAIPVAAAKPAEKCVVCEQGAAAEQGGASTYGTAIKFNSNPLQAADEANKEKKLLFVLHISGNFEDDRFT
jgi:hypothetical protein